MPIQKINRAGNSLAVILPSKVVKVLGLKSGDKVLVTVSLENMEVNYRFVEARQLSLSPKIDKQTKL